MSRLQTLKLSNRTSAIEYVEQFLLDRLQQPHSSECIVLLIYPVEGVLDNDETFQSYSSFTTNYKPPTEYEKSLVAASKSRNSSIRSWERREPFEYALVRLPVKAFLNLLVNIYSRSRSHLCKLLELTLRASGGQNEWTSSQRAAYMNEPSLKLHHEGSKENLEQNKR